MTQETDPWLDSEFTTLDNRTGPEHFAAQLAEIANNDPATFPPPVDPALAPVPPAPPVATYAPPETVQLENGATITYTEDERGWHAELDPGKGRPLEVFHARSPLELAKQLAVGKVNASIKINQQEAKLKVQKVDNPAPPKPAAAAQKTLTADQIFEIKTLNQSDPVAAFNKMCELTTGVDWATFVTWAKAGKQVQDQTQQQQTLKQIGDKFRRLVPAYYASDDNNNRMTDKLTEKGLDFNVENLIEVYQELSESGLLDDAPRTQAIPAAPAAITAPAATTPTLVAPDPAARIERPVGRPIATPAGFGLRPGESNARPPAPPDPTRVPSVEEIDNLPDADINQLFTDIRRFKAQSARR